MRKRMTGRTRVLALWLGVLCAVVLAGARVAGAEETQELTAAEIAEMSAYFEGKVAELEGRIDTLEGQIAVGEAAVASDVAVEGAQKTVQDMKDIKEQLEDALDRAKFYRDVYTAGMEDPAIVRQYIKVMILKENLEDAISEYQAWEKAEWERVMSGDQSWTNFRYRDMLLFRARYLRGEFDRENDKLGRMIQAFRDARSGGEGGGGGGGGGGCFPAGVLVAMADGGFKPIEEMEVGDRVLSMDFESGRTVPGEVTETLTQTEAFVLRINDSLLTNGAHRFYTTHGLKAARDIEPGDVLVGRTQSVAVARMEKLAPSALASLSGEEVGPSVRVYNITVEGTHTFYVSPDGGKSYLVHDSCGCAGREE